MRRHFLFDFVLILFLASLFGCGTRTTPTATPALSPTPPPEARLLDGKLTNQIERLEKDLPRANSAGYVVPTDEEKNIFAALVTDFYDGNISGANALADANEYELYWYTDHGDGDAPDYLLRERDPSKKGWGLYVFRIDSNSPIIVEAPHPLADDGTPLLALHIYRDLDARALLVAGAHRDANSDGSADAAHVTQSIFQSIHQTIVDQSLGASGADTIVLQIHGFGAARHPDYPQIIIGYDGPNAGIADRIRGASLVNKIAAALSAQKIRVGICGNDQWRDLCGETNAQAASMIKGIFIHIELDETIRADDSLFLKVLKEIFSQ